MSWSAYAKGAKQAVKAYVTKELTRYEEGYRKSGGETQLKEAQDIADVIGIVTRAIDDSTAHVEVACAGSRSTGYVNMTIDVKPLALHLDPPAEQ